MMRIRDRFLDYIKGKYNNSGDAIPLERWNIFIGTFGNDVSVAQKYLQELIKHGYFEEKVRNNNVICLVITRFGIDSIYNDDLPF